MKTKNVHGRRSLVLVAVVVAGLVGVFLGFRPSAVDVDVGTAVRGPLRVTVEQEGRTRVVNRYVVTAPVNGYAHRITLDPGDAIERGGALVELDSVRSEMPDARRRAEAQARIAAALAGVGMAEQRANAAAATASVTQTELKRVQALRAAGHVSAAAQDQAAATAEASAAQLRSARFAVATAQHELEAARTSLQFAGSAGGQAITIRSPVAGRVLKIARKSEGPVAAGQALIDIGDPRALEAEVDVLSADAVRMHPGTRVVFERWGGEGVLEGTVRIVEPAGFTKVSALGVEEQRVWVIVSFTSPAALWQRLGDGYRVEASFILWEAKDVLQVPASALLRDGNGWAVYRIEQGRAVKRPVQVGQRGGLQAQVLGGLAAGEQVVVHPDDRVRDGVRVLGR